MSVTDLRKQYPELAESKLVTVDIIDDDGETLKSIADSSVDFVIANHMIEHCQDPIGTIEQHLRVLKQGGILYMTKRYTFDKDRPETFLEHLNKMMIPISKILELILGCFLGKSIYWDLAKTLIKNND